LSTLSTHITEVFSEASGRNVTRRACEDGSSSCKDSCALALPTARVAATAAASREKRTEDEGEEGNEAKTIGTYQECPGHVLGKSLDLIKWS
jgi:hypothetical protein